MKKRIIAVSVAAAMGGFVGTAGAQTTANHLQFNPAGVGHILYVPYFSTQSGNVTAINIVNTDTKNGKALKVRFRGASNSDDVYDFQVFLSPGDVWTAGISNDGGVSRLDTADKSCTLPATVNGQFIISRTLGPAAADRPAETREGYVEILNMGDIVSDGSSGTTISNKQRLFNATKHVSGVAPCTASVMTALTQENGSTYLSNPTTGLMANWTIINVQSNTVSSYSGDASAIEARVSIGGAPGAGNIVYWDQRSLPLSCGQADANTADPLLRCSGISTTNTTPWVAGARYDLPDLSTPYTNGSTSPAIQALELSDAIATAVVAGEFYNLASVGASTDWVVSFPTRRYGAAVRYTGTGAPAPVYNTSNAFYFNAGNTAMGTAPRAYQLCQVLGTGAVAFYNREEVATQTDDIVISPGTPTTLNLCGEVAVVGINATSAATSATYGSLTRANVSNGFVEGWGTLTTPSANGLPFLARQYTRVADQTNNRLYGLSYSGRIVVKGAFAP